MNVFLNNVDEVTEFVNAASKSPNEINLESGCVFIDGKSFLGVLTMGLKRRMMVKVVGTDMEFANRIKKFAVAI